MDGVLVINKQGGMTSHDVVARVRRILKTKKVGHTGTLDPEATGILVVCVGKATKLSRFLMATRKEYIAEMELGVKTDSQDSSGRVVSRAPWEEITRPAVEEAMEGFSGEIEQVPPMVSAIKHRGKKLYELARKGREVEREPRRLFIHHIELLEFDPPRARFKVACSKGTYIRTLCSDIGDRLGCGAHQASLTRIRSGPFRIEDSVSLEELEKMARPEETVIPPDRALSFLPAVRVKKWFKKFVSKNAVLTDADIMEKPELPEGETVRIVDPEGRLLAVGSADSSGVGEEPVLRIVHRV